MYLCVVIYHIPVLPAASGLRCDPSHTCIYLQLLVYAQRSIGLISPSDIDLRWLSGYVGVCVCVCSTSPAHHHSCPFSSLLSHLNVRVDRNSWEEPGTQQRQLVLCVLFHSVFDSAACVVSLYRSAGLSSG